MRNDSVAKTVIVIVLLCGVCSIIVSTAAVSLRPIQEANSKAEIRRGILEVAGLYHPGADESALSKMVEDRIVDLSTGRFDDAIAADEFDMWNAADDPSLSRRLNRQEDLALIGRAPRYAKVHFIRRNGRLQYIVLPIYGYGLWSTLYGFIALEADGNTVYGIKFHQHKETPGLGGRVDDSSWREQWHGKRIYDDAMREQLTVGKCRPAGEREQAYELDGLSGATLTSCGVDNILRFWFSEDVYGRFLQLRPFDAAGTGGANGVG